jgi:hypothetical protein
MKLWKGQYDLEENEKRNAMPWDLIYPGTHYVPEEVYKERYATCEGCEFFTKKAPRVCKKCFCWMKVKCTIAIAYCPEGKWDAYEGEPATRHWFKSPEEQDKAEWAMDMLMEASVAAKKIVAEEDKALEDEEKST